MGKVSEVNTESENSRGQTKVLLGAEETEQTTEEDRMGYISILFVTVGLLVVLTVGTVSVILSVPTVCPKLDSLDYGRRRISVPTTFAHYASYNDTAIIPEGAVA